MFEYCTSEQIREIYEMAGKAIPYPDVLKTSDGKRIFDGETGTLVVFGGLKTKKLWRLHWDYLEALQEEEFRLY